jgi:hypothetical protein
MRNHETVVAQLVSGSFGAGPVSLDERARRPVQEASRAKAVA